MIRNNIEAEIEGKGFSMIKGKAARAATKE
jgi:hypothetical protein